MRFKDFMKENFVFDADVGRHHLGLAIRKHYAHLSGADRLVHILLANATQRSKTSAKNTNLLSSDPSPEA